MMEATRWSRAEIYDLDIVELMFWLKEIKSLNDDRARLRKDK